MKATYQTRDGRLTFEIEGTTQKDVFRELASVQEVFDSETYCGVCNGTDIRYLSRKVQDYDFYELACQNPQCRARFSFGQAKKGGDLFPKRRDDEGNWIPHGGWVRWKPEGESAAVPPASDPPKPRSKLSTPDGLQSSFDRLGDLFDKPAPTRLGPALDLIRDQMEAVAGNVGKDLFDEIYRAYSSSEDKGTTNSVKRLLRAMITKLDALKTGA